MRISTLGLENIKNKIVQMTARYNADHDIGVDYNYIDRELLDLIDRMHSEIVELTGRVFVLESRDD